MPFLWTSWATVAALCLYFWTIFLVGRARERCQVQAPSVDGPPEFLRAMRVQMNTVEQLLFFLPAMWLCAFWAGDRLAAGGGLIWVAARLWYALAYCRDPAKRGGGFALAALAALVLLLVAVAGMLGRIK